MVWIEKISFLVIILYRDSFLVTKNSLIYQITWSENILS